MIKKFLLLTLSIWLCLTSLTYAEDWMPDENLRQAVRKKLGIPNEIPMLPQDLLRLYDLGSIDEGIKNLRGLEHAVNLSFLHVAPSSVSDLRPLATLSNLRVLTLYENEISDITPLQGLQRLEELHLSSNNISDITPLAGLVNLEKLDLSFNNISDITPLRGLQRLEMLSLELNNISDFRPLLEVPRLEILYIGYNPGSNAALRLGLKPTDLQICEIPRTDVTVRVDSRNFPSIFAAWANIINMPMIEREEKLTYHDLFLSSPRFGETWVLTPQGRRLAGAVDLLSKPRREKSFSRNPNMITLVGIAYYSASPSKYPEDWPYWLRDTAGNRVPEADWGTYLIDFTQTETQEIAVQEAIAVAKCGLYDGIFFDWWSEEWNVLYNHGIGDEVYRPLGEEVKAKVSILRRIREAVGDDFLILVNTNRSKIPRSAPYVNGTFMETSQDYDGGYTYSGLAEIESTLLWSEKNFRHPQINCLEGWATPAEPLDSPTNQRWMRVFTTMSLTHSDGYVSLASGIGGFALHEHTYEIWQGHSDEHARGEPHDHQHEHYWYDFWGADLGRPVGAKATLYENRKGLFIREFTNGWAVYNRSGASQAIVFEDRVSSVENGMTNTIHFLPDLDGEIYLKAFVAADVNRDGVVNILDLVAVAGAFGEETPDVNGDGIVNILDLVAISSKMK